MKSLIVEANGIPFAALDEDEMNSLTESVYAQNQDSVSPRHRKLASRLVKQDIAEALLCNFSACIALQENRQQDYVDMMLDNFKNHIKRDSLEYGDEDIGVEMFVNTVKEMVLLEQLKARRSPVAKLQEQILFGKNYTADKMGGMLGEIRKRLVKITDLNLSLAKDREEFRDMERTFFKKAADMVGVKLPKPPGVGW